MSEEIRIDRRTLRGIRRKIQKAAERMEKLIEYKPVPCGYSIGPAPEEIADAYDLMREVMKKIDEYRERTI